MEPQNHVAVRTQRLGRRYGSLWAIKDLNLAIPQGELFGLLGPNGAGKTTLFNILSCQLRPTLGDAYVLGQSVTRASKAVKARIGIVPQRAAAYDKLSAMENMVLFSELYGLKGAQAYQECTKLLRSVSLWDRAHEPVGNYSGGMKHRLNIILGLVHDPDVVFFDEPTTGLDPIARKELWAIIRKLQARGKTIVLTTHYMQEAEELCDRVAILDGGAIVAQGKPKEMGASLEEAFFATTTTDSPTSRRRPT